MKWPWQRKRRRRRHHRGPVLPQFDARRMQRRILDTLEALALQSEDEYRRALELIPWNAIESELDRAFWDDANRTTAVAFLLEQQLLDCLNARRLAPEPEYRIEFLDELTGLDLQIALAEIAQQQAAQVVEPQPMEKIRHEIPKVTVTADLN